MAETRLTNRQMNLIAPQGFLINGKITPTVASDNLTVTIQTAGGATPSASDPVYCRIGDTVRSITGALSVTKNAGTNWFDSGSTQVKTKEVDYFVYLGYNATDGVVVGFSRIPNGYQYDSFSATTTNIKYCAISDISNAAAGDDYELVGRFAATLSGGAGYTWTVPTYTTGNLINYPIRTTRWMTYTPTVYGTTGSIGSYNATNQNGRYLIRDNSLFIATTLNHSNVGSWTGNLAHQLPFGVSSTEAAKVQPLLVGSIGTTAALAMEAYVYSVSAAGVVSFVSVINTTIYPYSSLATADWINIRGEFELA